MDQKLRECEKTIREFNLFKQTEQGKKDKKRVKPFIKDISGKLTSVQSKLQSLRNSLTVFSFGQRYKDAALQHERFGWFKFCKWSLLQQVIYTELLDECDARYQAVCSSFKRDPANPKLSA